MGKRREARRRVRMDVVYPHAPDRVWRALTDRRALAQWLMPNDFEPQLGHRFQFRPRTREDGSGPVQCEVTELEAPRRLAYTWRAPDDSAPSQVTWTLEPVARGTRVRLEHTARDIVSDTTADAIADEADTVDTSLESAWHGRLFNMRAQLSAAAIRPIRVRRRR